MGSKVSSDWLPTYIKAMRPVLKILKMDGYVPDSLRIWCIKCMLNLEVISFRVFSPKSKVNEPMNNRFRYVT